MPMPQRWRSWVAVLLWCSVVGDARAQSGGDVAKEFVGTWRLVSTIQSFADGTSRPDPQVGPTPLGYMIYTDTHRMCAMFTNPARPQWASPATPTDMELRSLVDFMGAYCGTYEVNVEQGFVVHHVEIERVPNFIGTTRKRFFTLNGDRLILTLDPATLTGGLVATTITWQRITP
jgi:hypothetical protein